MITAIPKGILVGRCSSRIDCETLDIAQIGFSRLTDFSDRYPVRVFAEALFKERLFVIGGVCLVLLLLRWCCCCRYLPIIAVAVSSRKSSGRR